MTSLMRAAAVALLVAGALGACGSGSDDNAATAGATASETSPSNELASATTTSEEPTAMTTVEDGGAAAESAETGPEGIVPGEDPEVDAVVTAWTTVFDSTAPVDAKTPFIQDAAALRPTLDAYAGGGAQVGGITLVPSAVAIEGDVARITYDVNFAGNEAYGDQDGELVRAEGVWVVAREQFCAFMASARTPCE